MALVVCLTTMAQDWRRQGSRVEEHTVKSEVLGADRAYTVYLPAGYDANKERTYPVLYLLHGMNDTNKGPCSQHSGIQACQGIYGES